MHDTNNYINHLDTNVKRAGGKNPSNVRLNYAMAVCLLEEIRRSREENVAWRRWVRDNLKTDPGDRLSECPNSPCPGCDRMPGSYDGWCLRCDAVLDDPTATSEVCASCSDVIESEL